MYSKSDITGRGESAYIPQNYRGNALYFERMSEDLPCEDEAPEKCERGDPHQNECQCDRGRVQEHECKTHNGQKQADCRCKQSTAESCRDRCDRRTGASSFLSSVFGSLKGDSLPIILLVLFFLLTGKDKEGTCTDDNTLLLLLLVLLL